MTTISFPNRQGEGIHISGLEVHYRRVLALKGINCEIRPGRVTGMIGPNGAGKSTLIKSMLGLVNPVRGKVCFQNQPLTEQLDQVAYLPQRSKIDWTYPATVWDVVMMGRVRKTGWFHRFSNVSRRLAAESLDRVGLSEYRDRAIGELSGGQQQRVFIARALAEQAHIFCFDEPFAGIDKKTESVIFDILHELAEAGHIVLVVHHDLGNSIVNFDDLILLNRELVAHGTRKEVLNADNLQHAYGDRIAFFSEAA
ncbi:MAG: metal ABC transporter ATP-binding protein [Halothece sp.]